MRAVDVMLGMIFLAVLALGASEIYAVTVLADAANHQMVADESN